MRVGYLGPEGTFGEEAARASRPDAQLIPFAGIEQTVAALLSGDTDLALLPIDNVIAGPVGETLDVLAAQREHVVIADMCVMPVRHALGSFGTQTSIRTICSRGNTLTQCDRFLSAHYPNTTREAVSSTSRAIADVAESRDKSIAAIGNPRAMERYGVPILERNISDQNNKMRFVLLARRDQGIRAPTGRDTTSLIITPPADRAGMLREALDIISGQFQLNVSALYSRPDQRGGLRFFLDIEGHVEDDPVANCLRELENELRTYRIELTVLGSFPRSSFSTKRIKSIGIIGGTGAMGQWFRQHLGSAGFDVLIAGRNTDLTYEECVAHSNAVLINVPIQHTEATIANIAPMMTAGQLLVDNTSVKTGPVNAMMLHAPSKVEVLGMHTVFGPAAASLRGQNVIFTRTARSTTLCKEFENIFYKHGARITYTDPAHHDKQMALHQNLEHFTKLVLAEVVCQSFDEPDTLDQYSSPNSRASLATMGRVLHTDLDLLAQIQMANAHGPQMIETYVNVANSLAQAIEKQDMNVLYKIVEKSAGKLGHRFLTRMLERARDQDQST
ncbi:MAG: prephenate dehydrogenase/arogenate dehydrogenase family protein [Gammaproteobacteria bacterium]